MIETLEPGVLLIKGSSSLVKPDLYLVVSRDWVLEENPNLRREEVEEKIPVKQLGMDEVLFHMDPGSIKLLDSIDRFLIIESAESIRQYYQSFHAQKGIGSSRMSRMRSEFALYVLFISCGGKVSLIPSQEREAYKFYFNQLQKALNHRVA